MKSRLVFIAICSCLVASVSASDSAKSASKQLMPTVPVPQTLDQMPAVPPQVSYQNGQLTINSQNCTLGDILKAVHAQTGAQIDLPGAATERVVGNFGPGSARDVLSDLLNGSHFNYVLMGSEANPEALDHVILTARTGGTGAGTPVQEANAQAFQGNPNYSPGQLNPNMNPNMMMRPMPPRPGMAPNMGNPQGQADNSGDNQQSDDSADDSQDDQNDDSADDQTDDSADDQGQEQTVQGEDANSNGNQGVKSPEQLLQELQQQQLQQQQQQQGDQPQQPVQPGMPHMPPGVVQPPH